MSQVIENHKASLVADVRENMAKCFPDTKLLSLAEYTTKATTGSRVCRYPDGQAPVLLYLAKDYADTAFNKLLATHTEQQPESDSWGFRDAIAQVGYDLAIVEGIDCWEHVHAAMCDATRDKRHVVGLHWEGFDPI